MIKGSNFFIKVNFVVIQNTGIQYMMKPFLSTDDDCLACILIPCWKMLIWSDNC